MIDSLYVRIMFVYWPLRVVQPLESFWRLKIALLAFQSL
ncbi:hypothetical protein BVRB_6g141500 [Beta vulgaris subsp. vulgaris]|nr:hypothetical protein BVRB_6g141500 [Beta vulgaris subsp. vulgaris]